MMLTAGRVLETIHLYSRYARLGIHSNFNCIWKARAGFETAVIRALRINNGERVSSSISW
jgi:hypothetical protein